MLEALRIRCSKFWGAEEIPRWFGMSVVLLYLLGLWGMGYFGMTQLRTESSEQLRSVTRYSLLLFGAELEQAARDDHPIEEGSSAGDAEEAPPEHARIFQRLLRDFAAEVPTVALRVLDEERNVLASTDPAEIGMHVAAETSGAWPPTTLSEGINTDLLTDDQQRVYQLPLSMAAATGADPADGGQAAIEGARRHHLFLEAVLPVNASGSAAMHEYSGMLSVALLVCGGLFVVYHRLRGQMRGLAHVARRLRANGERVTMDLEALPIVETADAVAESWNRLVSFAAELENELKTVAADREMASVSVVAGGQSLSEAINALPDGLVHLAAEGKVEFANSTALHLLDWNLDDVMGSKLDVAGGNTTAEAVRRVVAGAMNGETGYENAAELVEVEPSGNAFRVRVVPLSSPQRPEDAIVVIRDVSQQLRADKAREEFVTQVTHELRTPLTNIRAYAETLSSGMFDDPKVITECYNVITKETRRLSRLVEDMLNVSQMEVGGIELNKDVIDMKSVLEDGVRDVRGLAEEKNIDLQLVLPSKSESIEGDRDKLAVVINNLLGNAIKYTNDGGTVIAGCQFKPEEVVLTFKDNGIGIDPAFHAQVFEKFHRVNEPEVNSQSGTGIGLYTAREIVRRHGGEITVVSKKGEGSTFIVTLPRERSRASNLAPAGEAEQRG